MTLGNVILLLLVSSSYYVHGYRVVSEFAGGFRVAPPVSEVAGGVTPKQRVNRWNLSNHAEKGEEAKEGGVHKFRADPKADSVFEGEEAKEGGLYKVRADLKAGSVFEVEHNGSNIARHRSSPPNGSASMLSVLQTEEHRFEVSSAIENSAATVSTLETKGPHEANLDDYIKRQPLRKKNSRWWKAGFGLVDSLTWDSRELRLYATFLAYAKDFKDGTPPTYISLSDIAQEEPSVNGTTFSLKSKLRKQQGKTGGMYTFDAGNADDAKQWSEKIYEQITALHAPAGSDELQDADSISHVKSKPDNEPNALEFLNRSTSHASAPPVPTSNSDARDFQPRQSGERERLDEETAPQVAVVGNPLEVLSDPSGVTAAPQVRETEKKVPVRFASTEWALKKAKASGNRNKPADYVWLRESLQKVADHVAGTWWKNKNSHRALTKATTWVPMLFVIGGCPSALAGMQAIMVAVNLERDVDFWWVKPRKGDPTALEGETLWRHESGTHKNDPGRSKPFYKDMTELFSNFQPSSMHSTSRQWKFGFTLESEEAHAFLKSETETFYLVYIWQEDWTTNPFARSKYIKGKLVYKRDRTEALCYYRQYEIKDGIVRVAEFDDAPPRAEQQNELYTLGMVDDLKTLYDVFDDK